MLASAALLACAVAERFAWLAAGSCAGARSSQAYARVVRGAGVRAGILSRVEQLLAHFPERWVFY
jgi:hypothetical protein